MTQKSFKKLLLADDDSDDAGLFCEALLEVCPDASCFLANDGNEVLDKLPDMTELPDLIVLDVNMPLMDGWECLTLLKSNPEYQDIPVILYSTSSRPQDNQRARDLGAIFFYTKPEKFGDLKKFLKMVVQNFDKDLRSVLNNIIV